ncbi:MAG: hypothetical protein ACXWG0_07525 [Chthoniobacterales bacterium]
MCPDAQNSSVELRANFQPGVYGRGRSLLVQPAQIRIVLTDSENKEHSGRLIPGMAAAGFLVQPLLESFDDFSRYLDGTAVSSVRSIRFEPETGTAKCWSNIKVEIFRLPDLPLQVAPVK